MTGDTNQNKAAEETAIENETLEEKDFKETDGSDLFDESEEDADEEPEEDTNSEETDETDEKDEEEESEEAEPSKEPEKKPKEAEKKPDTSVKNMLKVIHNGKEREIDPMSDEAKTLIQKGLDYDHKSTKLAERDKVLTEYGRLNGGLSADEALNTLLTSVNAAAEQKELEALRAKYPNAEEEALVDLAKANAAKKAITIKKSAEETESAKRMQELQQEYPQYTSLTDLPKEIQDAVAGGKTPLQAVKDAEIAKLAEKVKELERELATTKQNNKNRDQSLPSVKGAANQRKKDAFEDAIGI